MNDVPHLEIPTIAVAHSNARFPVRRIFCVGQNYADHAREKHGEGLRPIRADRAIDAGSSTAPR
jgi:fumarylpyruvate hydrolase